MQSTLPARRESRDETTQSTPFYRSRLFTEFLLVGLGYLVYSQVRGLAGDRHSDAFANARHLADLERSLGMFHELSIQQWVLPSAFFIDIFNWIYFYGFFPVLIPTAIWLYMRRPRTYELARTAFLASGGIAVCFFLTLPTAPPRLADMGFIDTLNQSLTPTYSSIPGVNHYAALPSMHVGWTFLLATAIYLALPNFKFRGIAYVIPIAMFSATVVTGNHWFLDAVLGLAVALCGLGIALVLRRYLDARRASSTATTPDSSS
jgi:hypothetical protein